MRLANFTPQEIEQFLQEFFDVVGTRQYIGARYVPLIGRKGDESTEWDGGTGAYEPLTIVTYQGDSYTSRQYVPVGIPITNTAYWVRTGDYDAQVELYKRDVETIQATLPMPTFNPQNTVKDYIDAQIKPTPEEVEEIVKEWLDENPTAVAGMRSLGYLETNVDLNDFNENGFYVVLDNRTLTNAPTDYAGSNALLWIQNGANESTIALTFQTYYNWTTGSVHLRYRPVNNPNWSAWKRLNPTYDESLYTKGYLPNNVDLNSYYEDGYYIVLNNRTLTNAPDNHGGSYAALIVYNASLDSQIAQCIQLYVNYTKNTIHVRNRAQNGQFSQWVLMNPTFIYAKGYIATNEDLDTYYEDGYYLILNNRTLSNAPDNYTASYAALVVYNASLNSTVAMCIQMYLNYTKNTIHMRMRVPNGQFGQWVLMNPTYTYSHGYLDNGTDLDDLYVEGTYVTLSNRVLNNAPYPNAEALIIVSPAVNNAPASERFQIWIDNSNKETLYRVKPQNGEWGEWQPLITTFNNEATYYTNYTLPNTAIVATGENVGSTITILQFNVAHYMRGQAYMTDEQMLRFRQFMQYVAPDVALIAEDRQYIDGTTKAADEWLYNPILPIAYQNDETSIKSRYTLSNTGTVNLLGGLYRPMRYGTITVNNKTIAIGSVHLSVDSEATAPETGPSLRKTQLENAISILEQLSPDYIIIGGDLNTNSDEDLQNVIDVCGDHNLTPSNGGWLGWIETVPNTPDICLDNILVSEGIIINRYMVDTRWQLQSDHYPTFATLTIR